MIKNVIFDLGNVLLDWHPAEYFLSQGYSKETLKEINELAFGSDLWLEFDRGTLNSHEIFEILSEKRPELREELRDILKDRWMEVLTLMTETEAFLYELKNAGYKIYVLSNFSEEGFRYVEKKFGFFKDVDGMVISYLVKLIKPEPEIYELILSKYSLVPEETVFIDDLKHNLDAAEKLGINTIQFTNISQVRERFGAFPVTIQPIPKKPASNRSK